MSKMLYVDYLLEKDQKEYLDNLLGKCGVIKGNGYVEYYLEEKQIEAINALINKEGIAYYDSNSPTFQYGRKYYTIDSSGNIKFQTWYNDYVDIARRDMGNAFVTEEEAQFIVKKRKILAEMQKYTLPRKCVRSIWYELIYDVSINVIEIILHDKYKSTDLVFESREDAINCINFVGKEQIIKYYFGVE